MRAIIQHLRAAAPGLKVLARPGVGSSHASRHSFSRLATIVLCPACILRASQVLPTRGARFYS